MKQMCRDCKNNHSHDHNHSHGESKNAGETESFFRFWKLEIFTALLFVAGIMLRHTGVLAAIDGNIGFDIADFIVFLIAILPVGIPVVREMLESWRHGSVMNEFTLMVAASTGAFVIGEYPEAVAVLLFYCIGEKLEGKASDDVRSRIRKLLGRLPETATVIEGDKLRTVSPSELPEDSLLLVRPGERVPVDSTLLGDTPVEFDTSAITGESVPGTFKPGEELPSGIIPVDKAVKVRTVRRFSDSSMSRIFNMIENAQASKSPTETMLRRITRWYTPVVFTFAVLIFIVPWIISLFSGGVSFDWYKWTERSLVFLVCSCPCALVVSIPLSYFASLGTASKQGLLFKGSKHLDAMRSLRTVVFDKTGTLTTGEFHVSGITGASGISDINHDDGNRILRIAAAVDAESSHPLAKAICAEAARRKYSLPDASDVTTVPHGIIGKINGVTVAVGSPSLMKKLGIALPDRSGEGSEICVAEDNTYLGSIFLLDNIKPEAAKAVRELHRLGVTDVEILSGDRREAVARVAMQIGADGFRAELLPADKQRIVEELRQKGGKVAFAGDGINDAPAIASSDVGVSMGKLGTDMAMETSDVVIAGDNLEKLPQAIQLSRKVRSVVIQNVTFALLVKMTVMALGTFGIATLWAAVFADTGVTLITILWTLLRLRI